jgi:hypothetical protein
MIEAGVSCCRRRKAQAQDGTKLTAAAVDHHPANPCSTQATQTSAFASSPKATCPIMACHSGPTLLSHCSRKIEAAGSAHVARQICCPECRVGSIQNEVERLVLPDGVLRTRSRAGAGCKSGVSASREAGPDTQELTMADSFLEKSSMDGSCGCCSIKFCRIARMSLRCGVYCDQLPPVSLRDGCPKLTGEMMMLIPAIMATFYYQPSPA